MTNNYREVFLVNGTICEIVSQYEAADEELEGRFSVRYAGNRIGGTNDLNEARKMLHVYLTSQLAAEVDGYQRELDRAQRALGALGGDVFNLGRFSNWRENENG